MTENKVEERNRSLRLCSIIVIHDTVTSLTKNREATASFLRLSFDLEINRFNVVVESSSFPDSRLLFKDLIYGP